MPIIGVDYVVKSNSRSCEKKTARVEPHGLKPVAPNFFPLVGRNPKAGRLLLFIHGLQVRGLLANG
jgi:hypothetical protein